MTKLTAVSIWFRGVRHTYFVELAVENGKPILPAADLDLLLDRIGVRRGDTFAVGA